MRNLLAALLCLVFVGSAEAINVRGGGSTGGDGRTLVSEFETKPNAAQTLSSGAVVDIVWDADAAVQTESLTWLAADGELIVIPAGVTSIDLEAQISSDATAAESRWQVLVKHEAVLDVDTVAGLNISLAQTGYHQNGQVGSTNIYAQRIAVAATDTIEISIIQNTGGNVDTATATSFVRLRGYN